MSELLSDAEVFGAAPKLLSDAEVGFSRDYWNAPKIERQRPTGFGDLVRHPVRAAQALGRRFGEVTDDTLRRGTLTGVGANALTDFVSSGLNQDYSPAVREALRQARIEDEKASRPRPAGTVLEHILDFGAGVAGSIPSPESWVNVPIKGLQLVGRPIVSNIAQRSASAGAANVLTDPLVQAGNIGRGIQDQYSPGQTAMSGLVGMGVGGTIAGGQAAIGQGRMLGEAVRDLREAPFVTGRDPEYAARQAELRTVGGLWPRLVRQESGGDQEAVSPKGAFGKAQLMPGTAETVAKALGNPKLADIARENSLRGGIANEMLGQTYLGWQLRDFGGDPMLALAAYNAGPARVREWISRFGHPDQVGRSRWAAMIPFEETRKYVRSILGKDGPGEYKLSSEEMSFVRAKSPDFPDDDTVTLPPTDEAPTPIYPDEAFPKPTGEIRQSIPWDDEDGPIADGGDPMPDITDRALDHMRSGKPLRMGEGPSLVDALIKEGGLRDEGGELTNILGGEGTDRGLKMLRRVNTGMTLDDAAQWAQERGYIGKPDLTERASIQELLDAVADEVRGNRRYPADRVNQDARDIGEHIAELEELLAHLGMDPKTHSNAEIKARLERFFLEADELEPGSLGMTLAMGARSGDPAVRARIAALGESVRMREMVDGMLGSTKPGAMPGSRVPGAVPMGAGEVPKVKGLADISKQLRKDLDVIQRQGRITMRNALGVYSRRTGIVRTKQMQELDVLSHEIGHALEFTRRYPNVLNAMKKHTPVLKALDYDPKKRRRHEGFAEWFRTYVTNPAYARTTAPGFTADFEAAMAIDAPKDLAAIQRAQADYEAFLTSPSVAATTAQVKRPPKRGFLAEMMELAKDKNPFAAAAMVGDEVYRGVVDFLHPWKRAVDELLDVAEARTGVRPSLSVMGDPYKLLRLMPAVTSAGHMDLIHGVHGYHELTPGSASFAGALSKALGEKAWNWDEDAIDQFGAYLVARRVLHLYDRVGKVWTDAEGRRHGIERAPDALTREAWQQTKDDLEAANPEWSDAAEMIYDWNNALWAKRYQAGLITEADYLAGLNDHPDYVPLFRDVSDKGIEGGARGRSTKQAGGVVRLEGSDRAYINPVHSMMQMAYELNTIIARNDALKALDDLGRLFGPDAGRVVERLPKTEIRPGTVPIEEALENMGKTYGVDRRDALELIDSVRELFGDDATATIYRAVEAPERGEPIAYVWREGERIPLRLPDGRWGKDMVEALAGMSAPMRSLALEFAATPARVLRAGVTANPAFWIANTIRDQMTAAILTDVGFRPFWDQAKGLTHYVRGDDLSRIYNVAGGEVGGQQSAAEAAAAGDRNIQALNQRGHRVKSVASWQGLAHLTESSETGTRLGIFDRAYGQAKEGGFSDFAAAREAAFEARDYMDFDRHGAFPGVRAAVRVIPFLNAGIQALDKTRRVGAGVMHAPEIFRALAGGAPASRQAEKEFAHALKLIAVASVLGVGGLSLRIAYADDPEYQEVADYLRNTHWVVKLPGGDFLAVPKPYDIAIVSNILERAYEGVALKDPTAWKRLGVGIAEITVPAHDVTAIAPFWQIARNRDAFGAPIVPDYMKSGETRVEPRDQYTDRTSKLARMLGEHMGERGTSPAVIEHLMKSLGGSNVRDALAISEMAVGDKAPMERDLTQLPVTQRFVKEWTRGSVSGKQFNDLLSASDGKWTASAGSIRRLVVNQGNFEEAAKRLNEMKPDERAFVIMSVFGSGQEKQAHPMIRAQESTRVLAQLAADLSKGNVRGPDLKPIAIDPAQRHDAIRALRQMAVSEQRNGMIMAGAKGWEGREPLPFVQYMGDLQKAAPQLLPALLGRYAEADVAPAPETAQSWRVLRPVLEAKPNALWLQQAMAEKRFPDSAAGDRRMLLDVAPAR